MKTAWQSKGLSEMSDEDLKNYYNDINSNVRKVSSVLNAVNHDIDDIREKARVQAQELIRSLQAAANGEKTAVNPDSFKELALVLRMGLNR